MKRALDSAVETLGEGLRELPWEDPVAYAMWLSQTYYYVRHSTRLLAVAAARFAFDPGGNALHHRFAVHMAEEKQHELLAADDLKALHAAPVSEMPELASTRALYEAQYFKIEHIDPFALLGYVLPLEVMSAKHGPAAHVRAQRTWGSRACTFLKVHVEEDVDHVEKAVAATENLSPEQKQMLAGCFEQTAFSYCAMLRDIRQRAAVIATASGGEREDRSVGRSDRDRVRGARGAGGADGSEARAQLVVPGRGDATGEEPAQRLLDVGADVCGVGASPGKRHGGESRSHHRGVETLPLHRPGQTDERRGVAIEQRVDGGARTVGGRLRALGDDDQATDVLGEEERVPPQVDLGLIVVLGLAAAVVDHDEHVAPARGGDAEGIRRVHLATPMIGSLAGNLSARIRGRSRIVVATRTCVAGVRLA